MRSFLFWFTLFLAFDSLSASHTIFEKDGYFGIKDGEGQVTVPPVYEQLGWTGGSSTIVEDIIGYKVGGLWGLISVKNKVLTPARFHSLEPFNTEYIKGSRKGKFSNQLFYGLLSLNGKVKISFNYFTLDILQDALLVSLYEGRQKFGVVSMQNEWILPARYKSIMLEGLLYKCTTSEGSLDLYSKNGSIIKSGIDSLKTTPKGCVAFDSGYAGFISNSGNLELEFSYKDIQIDESVIPIPFPTWEVYFKDKFSFSVEADSIQKFETSGWQVYANGSHHFSLFDSSFHFKNYYLAELLETYFILKNLQSGKWSVRNMNNEVLMSGYDSIFSARYGLWGRQEGLWKLYNRYGKPKNRLGFGEIKEGVDGQFIVNLHSHWGILDPLGKKVTPIKFDLVESIGSVYKIDYLNRNGVMDTQGNWILRPEYSEVYFFDNLFAGKKEYSYSYSSKTGFIKKSTYKPIIPLNNMLKVEEGGYYGLMDSAGMVQIDLTYKSINADASGYFILENEFTSIADQYGKLVFGDDQKFENFGGYSECLFLIKKDHKWGFVDKSGRLRISNRYDHAQPFSEGLAPVQLRGKWGFIDKQESIVIQPFYEYVSPMIGGLTIIEEDNAYGILNASGEEVVKPEWEKIERLASGNYLVTDHNNSVGLISSEGEFFFRPMFEQLIDVNNKVIVTQNGVKGILDYTGNQLFRIEHKEIKILGDYTILMH